MNIYKKLLSGKTALSVIGLGYVGLNLAVEFSRKIPVVGYDINKDKINNLLNNMDMTGEVSTEELNNCSVLFTYDESYLRKCSVHLIAVPTPTHSNNKPNLQPLEAAVATVGRNLSKGSIVVIESTVYPGTTEEICVPILEKESGLIYKKDFFVAYSPERINPTDKVNTLKNIVKIVSGDTDETLKEVSSIYKLVLEDNVYLAPNIKVAEMSKLMENTQRNINIAFMNEMSIICNKMSINTQEVIKAASTKWNFAHYTPGLVGGHCISVDPDYLIHISEEYNYTPYLTKYSRILNDNMSSYVVDNILENLRRNNLDTKGFRMAILGVTFKEDCPDLRNSKVFEIISKLKFYQMDLVVIDPVANPFEVLNSYNIPLDGIHELKDVDGILLAVPHKEFLGFDLNKLTLDKSNNKFMFFDIKGIYDKKLENEKILEWSL
ncbi:nucleotide sugar dehydrogenase [Lysinibacillus sp. NPDC093190]|uniref:nucleotide sugar dehydrogenase n=1 Tax=Lysinibacillus sp. NPDC093190 TaxID=3390575 RepID=UPI003D005D86